MQLVIIQMVIERRFGRVSLVQHLVQQDNINLKLVLQAPIECVVPVTLAHIPTVEQLSAHHAQLERCRRRLVQAHAEPVTVAHTPTNPDQLTVYNVQVEITVHGME
jgi:hypothetical protein